MTNFTYHNCYWSILVSDSYPFLFPAAMAQRNPWLERGTLIFHAHRSAMQLNFSGHFLNLNGARGGYTTPFQWSIFTNGMGTHCQYSININYFLYIWQCCFTQYNVWWNIIAFYFYFLSKTWEWLDTKINIPLINHRLIETCLIK